MCEDYAFLVEYDPVAGNWQVTVNCRDEYGEEQEFVVSGFASDDEAHEWIHETFADPRAWV